MSLHLIWKGKRRHQMKHRYNYRYIYPSRTESGLSSFYGPDRSFCRGMIFDTTDFIIEFKLARTAVIDQIDHHIGSYRGCINRDNSKIIAIYFKEKPLDYNLTEFYQHLNTLLNQVPVGTKLYQYQSCDDLSSRHVILKRQWGKRLPP